MSRSVNIFYLSNERFPAKLACTIQQTAMCEAFARAGATVTLLYPHYFDVPPADAAEIQRFYDVEPIFAVTRLPSLLSLSKPLVDGRRRLKIPLIGGLSIFLSTQWYAGKLLKAQQLRDAVIYCRTVIGAQAFITLRRKTRTPFLVIFEVHSLDEQTPRRWFFNVLRKADGLVAISQALEKRLVTTLGLSSQKILVAPSAVRAKILSVGLSRDAARAQTALPNAPLVLYAGQLLPGKGAELLLEASARLNRYAHVLIVGGHGAYLQALRRRCAEKNLTRVTLTGFVPPAQVPLYLAAADVLVLPTAADYVAGEYTSPLKLFEYMAARRPIVASDLPVLREILRDGDNALLFRSGDAEDLAVQINRLLDDPHLGTKLAAQAFADVQEFTWQKRAEKILSFVKTL